MMHIRRENLGAGGVDRRRNRLRNWISRSGLFNFFPNELDGVVGEDAEMAVLVEGAQEKPLYAGLDEFP